MVLLFSFSALCWADAPVYDGPDLPEGWYPIHETELQSIDQELNQAEAELSQARTQAETALNISTGLVSTFNQLETSFNEFESEAMRQIRNLTVELWIERGVTFGLVVLSIWALVR